MELFARRNFTCDCGTTRLPETSPCTLRIDPATGLKGPVHSQKPAPGNTYNQNFRNRFCGCGDWYDPHKQKGTMFQCLGLATEQDGGCGEDWWHPECLLGLPHDWYQKRKEEAPLKDEAMAHVNGTSNEEPADGHDEHPVPRGFPHEEEFDTLICYKCVETNPWIKRYAGSKGFMTQKFKSSPEDGHTAAKEQDTESRLNDSLAASADVASDGQVQQGRKRKAEGGASDSDSVASKRTKTEGEDIAAPAPLHASLPQAPSGVYSIFAEDDEFRTRFCRCAECYSEVAKHPQLLEEEETYEPPVSEEGEAQGGSVGTGSLLERGEAALSNVDRVRAIEGVMVYNHLRDKVKSFLQPFAESGQAVGAEDIKAYFEKLRGDHEAIRTAGGVAAANSGDDGSGGDNRKEQSGKDALWFS